MTQLRPNLHHSLMQSQPSEEENRSESAALDLAALRATVDGVALGISFTVDSNMYGVQHGGVGPPLAQYGSPELLLPCNNASRAYRAQHLLNSHARALRST